MTYDLINDWIKFQLSKPIENLISIPNENTIVLYTDGTCESLECAIDSRKAKKDPLLLQNKPIIDPETAQILDPTHFDVTNESILFTYFTQSRKTNDVHLVFFDLNGDTLQIEGPVTKLKLVREDRDTKLVGCTVVDSTVCPQLVTMCKLQHNEYIFNDFQFNSNLFVQGRIIVCFCCHCAAVSHCRIMYLVILWQW